jgi:predicted PurR-regulated permease PerM
VKSLGILIHTFSIATYIIIYIMLLLVFFVAFCLYMTPIKDWLRQFLPHSKREHIGELSCTIYKAAGTFFRTRLMIAFILSISFSVGWAIAGVPYWLLLGTATGILSIIPYAAALGWIAAMLFNVLETGSSSPLLYALLWPTLVYAVIQLVEGWLLTPWLQGGRLHIHPVVVLFAVLAGGTLAGLLGMLLAIPLTAAGQIVFSDIIKPKLTGWAKEH